jgi:flagellar motility protein MotE (MotC chaperone)
MTGFFHRFRPRILPFAIVFTMLGVGMRTADLVSLAVTGNGLSAITTVKAETTPDPKDTKKPSTDAKDPGTKVASAESPAPGLPSHPPVAEATKQETELLGSLTEKHKALDERAQALDQREALLNAAEDRVNKKIEELSGMRSDLEKLLDLQKTKDAAQMASLIKIYENMKPKDAAEIFDSLDLPVLVDVSAGMKESKIAPVLAAMNPDRARLLTVKLAEHRRNMEGAVADAKAALGPDATPAATPTPDAAAALPTPPTDAAKK